MARVSDKQEQEDSYKIKIAQTCPCICTGINLLCQAVERAKKLN